MRSWTIIAATGLLATGLLLVGCSQDPVASDTSHADAAPKGSGAMASPSTAPARAKPSKPDDPIQAEVRQVLKSYKEAVVRKRGDAAAELVSQRTISYFDSARKKALYAPKEALVSLPLFDQLMVLTLRARIPTDDIDKSDGKALFARGVTEGWTGAVARNFGDGEIVVDGDTAILMSRQKPWLKGKPDKGFRAYREEGAWKLDVIAIASLAASRLNMQLPKIDKDPQVALVKLTEKLTGKHLPADIWDAPRKESE